MVGPELNDAVPGTVHGVEGCHQRGKGFTDYGTWTGEPRARRFVIGFQDRYTEGQWLSQHTKAGQNLGAGLGDESPELLDGSQSPGLGW